LQSASCSLRDYYKPRQQLEAEILVLRHQLNVLQQRAPRRPHLRWHRRGFAALLAMEVSLTRWPAPDRQRGAGSDLIKESELAVY
jgi:hypothetical protein